MSAPLPSWAVYEGDPHEAFTVWHGARCRRAGCGVPRWAHVANAIASQRGAGAYWQTCEGFVEPEGAAGAPVAVGDPSPDGGRWARAGAVAGGAA